LKGSQRNVSLNLNYSIRDSCLWAWSPTNVSKPWLIGSFRVLHFNQNSGRD